MAEPSTSSGLLRRRRLLRIFVSGLLAMVVLYLGLRLIYELLPWINRFENPVVAFLVTLLSLLILPFLLGLIVEFGVAPLLGRWSTGSALLDFQDRLTRGLADAHPEIVLVNHPDKSTRSFGILTARYPGRAQGDGLASVFVPWGPQTRRGRIHIVAIEDLEFTDWTFQELQIFLMSFGTLGPERLNARPMPENPDQVGPDQVH